MSYIIRKLEDSEEIKTVCGKAQELITSSDFKEVALQNIEVIS